MPAALSVGDFIPDGVFVLDGDGPARFVVIPAPCDEDVEAILRRVIRRAAKALVGHGEDLDSEAEALAALQAAEVDRRFRYPDPFPHARRSAFLDGFSLHAGVRIHANDRAGLERLCRYALRPPLSLQRLSKEEAGHLVYRMKRPGAASLFLLLTPDELLAKLATLVPPPRAHAVRYHGVFAPHSGARSRVVPLLPAPTTQASPPAAPALGPPAASGRPIESRPEPKPASAARTYRAPWADLLKEGLRPRRPRLSRVQRPHEAHRLHRQRSGGPTDPGSPRTRLHRAPARATHGG